MTYLPTRQRFIALRAVRCLAGATCKGQCFCRRPGIRLIAYCRSPTQPDCNVNVNGNAGCGVRMSTPLSYGPSFNANGGGWFVTERTSAAISVWFWARNDPSVPAAVRDRRNDIVSGDLVRAFNRSRATRMLKDHFCGRELLKRTFQTQTATLGATSVP